MYGSNPSLLEENISYLHVFVWREMNDRTLTAGNDLLELVC